LDVDSDEDIEEEEIDMDELLLRSQMFSNFIRRESIKDLFDNKEG
jgi:hypothetical protein